MPEYGPDGHQLSPEEIGERNERERQRRQELAERETRERLKILRDNEAIAGKLDDLSEKLGLNSDLDAKIEMENAAYAELKNQTEEYRKTLAELQEAVKNRPKDNGGGNEGEILELLSMTYELAEKMEKTEKEKTEISEEYAYQKQKRKEETERHKKQLETERKWSSHLNDELKKTKMTKAEFEDDKARIEKHKKGKK